MRCFCMASLFASTNRQSRGTPPQPDIMEKLIHIHDIKPSEFDDEAVRSMVATNVFGGAETTTSSTTYSCSHLLLIEEHGCKGEFAAGDRPDLSRACMAF